MEESQNRVLTSSHRVATQISKFSKEVLSGANATDILSTSLESLERSLRLPLSALAELGAGAAAVFEIGNIITSFEKLNSEIENLTKPRDFSKLSLKEIEKATDEAQQTIEKLNANQKSFFNKSIKQPFEEL